MFIKTYQLGIECKLVYRIVIIYILWSLTALSRQLIIIICIVVYNTRVLWFIEKKIIILEEIIFDFHDTYDINVLFLGSI